MDKGPLGEPRPFIKGSMYIKAYPEDDAYWSTDSFKLEEDIRSKALLYDPVKVDAEVKKNTTQEAFIELRGGMSLESFNKILDILSDNIRNGSLDEEMTSIRS